MKFNEIFEVQYDGELVKINNFFYCTECTDIICSAYKDGNTNQLLRHVCYENNRTGSRKKTSKIMIQKSDKEEMKAAAAKFVSKDLRPFHAIQGNNFYQNHICINTYSIKKIYIPNSNTILHLNTVFFRLR